MSSLSRDTSLHMVAEEGGGGQGSKWAFYVSFVDIDSVGYQNGN